MKNVLFAVVLLASSLSFATDNLKCFDQAEKEGAKVEEISVQEFHEQFSVVWVCRLKKNPKIELYRFSDGGTVVDVSVKSVSSGCQTRAVEVSQDDQDGPLDGDNSLCLP
ncbi:hypothetical protein [Bdellovibrio sp. HCB337]|uniref:hypothetical protein n=1 Tax=Bdellovibrio sp. HCB337 TaxID=3394358 RepID=UPI0039A5D1CA